MYDMTVFCCDILTENHLSSKKKNQFGNGYEYEVIALMIFLPCSLLSGFLSSSSSPDRFLWVVQWCSVSDPLTTRRPWSLNSWQALSLLAWSMKMMMNVAQHLQSSPKIGQDVPKQKYYGQTMRGVQFYSRSVCKVCL